MKQSIVIIGSGPSALMLAATLDERAYDITVFEKNFAPARKFLVAGDGGFNLTHSESIEQFVSRYTPPEFLDKAIRSFCNNDLCNWLNYIGIETYIGTSKRMFPVDGIKPNDVLNAILKVISRKNIPIKPKNTWKGWNENGDLIIDHNYKDHVVKADIVVYALGGASWAKTGSDGSWINLFEAKGIKTVPFQPSNCAFEVKWDEKFIDQEEGLPLKNIEVSCNGKTKKGELVLTRFGIEGGAVYPLSPEIRKQLNEHNTATIFIDLKPTQSLAEIKKRLVGKGTKSITTVLNDSLNLTKLQIALLKTILTKEEFTQPAVLATKIKQLPLQITGLGPIDEAISTVGGIALDEVDKNFQLKKMPNHYVIGEMLDWDAPTGGYLLQANFSMGHYLAEKLNEDSKALDE
jgi:uncharacterized flavoprotein (TIGR03862 family)